ncbi:CocE/NonD family hydrolase [Nocardioides daphniae]|uniref:CocE/NonD family hydrolase n=1 Tax=Nocardioides daphniae TaxID=402297 RepID=UPI001E3F2B89|nr:CocE/NonD family hydrolase [Nocardioides daphniae]
MARLLKMPWGTCDATVTLHRVVMRDGASLLTDVHFPATTPDGAALGTVLIRTPYGRRGLLAELTAGWLASHGYRVVNQSCRGTAGSGGTFDPFAQEVDDGADTVSWLRCQPWFDGRFALWGASYVGHAAWAVMVDPPPELAAAVVAVSAHDGHWVAHGAGAFALDEVVGLMDGLAHLDAGPRGLLSAASARRRQRPAFEELPLVAAQETVFADTGMLYRDWLLATDPGDRVWRRMRLGEALDRVEVPVLLQAGWQDRFSTQMFEQHDRLRRRGVVVGLTVGPWTHLQAATTGAGILMVEALDWLDEHLAGTDARRPSPVRLFVTGAEEWRDLETWPPPTHEHVLHLHPHGALAEAAPAAGSGPSVFTYNPARPTPAVGGRVTNPAIGGRRDNRRLEQRDDVLTFTTAPLTEPMEVMGSPAVELFHATDNPYADLFVRLCEVTEDGRSVNLSDGFRRLGPADANGSVEISLDAVAHRFNPGVRLRLQVSGGAHPRYARQLGTSEGPATSTAMANSHRTISHGDGGSSRLLLPCLPATPVERA